MKVPSINVIVSGEVMTKVFFRLFAILLSFSFILHAQEGASATSDPSEYVEPSLLKTGDELSIKVFRAAEFNSVVRIDSDGTFRFPLIGEIPAAGKTTKEVALILTEKIASKVANPFVEVNVVNWGPRTVNILGEVARSGISLELPTNSIMTALQAISTAGGFTPSADLTKVVVQRFDPKNKIHERLPIDVSALVSDNGQSKEFVLHPGDMIIVPKAPPVYITGEVQKTGEYFIDTQRPPRCSEILVRAGGLTKEADAEHVKLIRMDKNGKRHANLLSLREIENGAYEKDPVIQPGDYIVVDLLQTDNTVYVSGAVGRPGEFSIDPKRPPRCSEMIIRAGGLAVTADSANVRLIRVDANGNRTAKTLTLPEVEDSNYDNDILVAPGDYIVVGYAEQIYILGEVRRPGPLTIPPYSTITAQKAIALAGGFTSLAKKNDILLIRNNTISPVNLKKTYTTESNLGNDIPLQYGDILFVQESIW